MKLHLADDLRFPVEAATETLLVVGKRGSGKSSTATRFAEQLIRAQIPIAVLDPADVWWGLKAGKDGQREGGLEVYVFGGRHADLPLEPTGAAGALLADVIVDNRISVVMVIREFSNREKAAFCVGFAERLFQRNRDPLHVFCEEAHEVMPQRPFKGEELMLNRMLRLQKLGRTSGIGLSSITQRPASLSKDATTQAEILVAHRLLGPQDRKAIEDWIKHHHGEDLKDQVLATLPELKTGDAWVWAPDFPEDKPIGLKRVHFLEPETFDSRKTPKPGEHRREPKQLMPVDLEKLRSKMAQTLERAKQEDPRELRAEIARLRGALRSQQPVIRDIKREVTAVEKLVKVPALSKREWKQIDKAMHEFDGAANQATHASELVRSMAAMVLERLGYWKDGTPPREELSRRSGTSGEGAPRRQRAAVPTVARSFHHMDNIPNTEAIRLGVGEKRILAATAQYPEGVTREQLTVLTGYRRSSRDTYLQRLRAAGWVHIGARVFATPEGIAALGDDYTPLPSGLALQTYWLGRLPEGERKILEVILRVYPQDIDREQLSDETGYKRSSRDTYLQRLRARELVIANGRGPVKASAMLFE